MKLLLLLFPLLFVISCVGKSGTVEEQKSKQNPASLNKSGYASESFREEDAKAKAYLEGLLKPIKDNFKRINSIPNNEWSSIIPKELDQPKEAGVATFYFYNASLEKITVRYYRETRQQLVEYYLMKGKLSFVLEKDTEYNRPVNYDAAHVVGKEDTVAFDTISEIGGAGYYFKYGVLVYVAGGKHDNAPLAKDYLEEKQRRILADFSALIKLSKH